MDRIRMLACIVVLLFLSCCATSNHGAFVATSYVQENDKTGTKIAGKVTGESRQTWFFYIFPMGEAPSTNEAILDAKLKIEGTKFLTDLSIDDRTYWKFGYSEQVVKVEATAYK